ncbi:ABC transporter permease [Streptomyces europaeiscabiei]|uniref:ABC transporter permease n=1 Tax=Streptomyces europaeiscabiei TaxID=146819 RepID=UPI0029AF46C3|nr:ABC transporter permease [Streptomyces europaeiscabiei]MDX2522887.1 ABC transporter permease [Streptomyces europaeiscabiei]MDX2758833.1 ABC transporter permease [Streptomyces europaeiscabiei]MDX3710042.1 ABC transporter permease [Streptomyces europaeiscabiei]MDX3782480.1 ABC transporter permease [Streptomyces europaeiscabiei]MDX3845055.1 ABC transporter permease [Streptomyces europaeiscabiei]
MTATTTAITHTPTRPTAVKGSATAVLKAEARLFLREPAALFWILAFPTVLLCVLGSIPSFREPSADPNGLRPVDLYVPVAVLLAVIMSGIQAMPPVLTGYRERGILRRMSTTPVRPGALIGAQIVLHGAAVVLSASLALAVGRFVFDVALPRQAAGYLVAFVLATLATLAIGGTVSAVSRTTKITQAVGSVVFFPVMFTSGVWLPVSAMPDALQRIVELTPLGAAAQALDAAAAGDWPSWTHLGVTALWAVLLMAAARRWFKWE